MLSAWVEVPCIEATDDHGRTYRVIRSPHLLRTGKDWVAICSFEDARGKLWEHIVGSFATMGEAKYACELDSKE